MNGPSYTALDILSWIIRVIGLLFVAAGLAYPLYADSQRAPYEFGMIVLCLAGLGHMAVGESLQALRQIAINSERWGSTPTAHPVSSPGLTQAQVEAAVINALRDSRAFNSDETPNGGTAEEVSRIVATQGRVVVCEHCRKRIRIASGSQFAPGATAKCPSCHGVIHV